MGDRRSREAAKAATLEPPPRIPLHRASRTQLDLVMCEYNAIRGEVQATLTNQVAVLSFGAAAVGLVFAAAATLWDRPAVVPAVLFLGGAPVVSFLTLAVYSGELIRMMRAGLFLNRLEFAVNESPTLGEPAAADTAGWPPAQGHVLCWEQWSHIRREGRDIDRINRVCIFAVFVLLALGSAGVGCVRLYRDEKAEWAAFPALGVSLVIGALSLWWLHTLVRSAYRYRMLYDYNADFPGWRPDEFERDEVRCARPLEPGLLDLILRRGGRAAVAGPAPRAPARQGLP